MSAIQAEGYLRPVERTEAGSFKDNIVWEAPIPLKRSDAMPDIDLDIIPEVHCIRDYVVRIAEAYNSQACAPAVILMLGLCGLVGSRAGIKPYREQDIVFYPNTWGGIIASSGQRKSAILKAALAPLLKVDSLLAQDRKDHVAKRCIDIEVLDKKVKDALKKGAVNTETYAMQKELNRLKADHGQFRVISDPTPEAMGELMLCNAGGLTLYRDELSGLIESMEKENQKGARQFYLEAWEGGAAHSVHRIGRGNIEIPSRTLSVVGGIQPDVIGSIVSSSVKVGSAKNDGFIQRFQLMVYPDKRPYKATDVSTVLPEELVALFMGLEVELPCTPDHTGKFYPHVYHTDDQAFKFWMEWSEYWGIKASEEIPALESHYTKYLSLMAGLGLVFTLIHGRDLVALEDMQRAARWCEYLALHARKIYGCTRGESPTEVFCRKIQEGAVEDGSTQKSLLDRNILGKDKRVEFYQALTELVDANWITIENAAKGSKILHINPAVYALGVVS